MDKLQINLTEMLISENEISVNTILKQIFMNCSKSILCE